MEKDESLRHGGDGAMVDVDRALMPEGAERMEPVCSDAIQEKPNFKERRRIGEATPQPIDGPWWTRPNE